MISPADSARLLEAVHLPPLTEESEGDAELVVAVIDGSAAGNQGAVKASIITMHHTVISVVACEASGRPLDQSTAYPSPAA
jgi:hypothetical protein